jgi:hypothetical protein
MLTRKEIANQPNIKFAGSAQGEKSAPFHAAILLRMLATRAQCDYNAIRRRGPSWTAAKPLKSMPIQYQSNVRVKADASDSKSNPRKGPWVKVQHSG